uniref:Uncharacterized protein n=1 Tax=Timema cristinae TaxID=61476 RepID=A0A7R9CDK1_TIMCR|nr:unnamed protein product [Timema cristinae]
MDVLSEVKEVRYIADKMTKHRHRSINSPSGGHHYIASPLHRMSIISRFRNKYIAGPSRRISPTSLYPANPTLTYNQ